MDNDRILLSETIERIGTAVDDIREAVGSVGTTIEEVAEEVKAKVGSYYVVDSELDMYELENVKEGAVCYCHPGDLKWRNWDDSSIWSCILAFPEKVSIPIDKLTPKFPKYWTAAIDTTGEIQTDILTSAICLNSINSGVRYEFSFSINETDGSDGIREILEVSYSGAPDSVADCVNFVRETFSYKRDPKNSYSLDNNDTVIFERPITIEGSSGTTNELLGYFVKTPVDLPYIKGSALLSEPYKVLTLGKSFTLSTPVTHNTSATFWEKLNEDDDPSQDGEDVGEMRSYVLSNGTTDLYFSWHKEGVLPTTVNAWYHAADGLHFTLQESSGGSTTYPYVPFWIRGENMIVIGNPSSGFNINTLGQIMKGVPYESIIKTYVYTGGEWVCKDKHASGFPQC